MSNNALRKRASIKLPSCPSCVALFVALFFVSIVAGPTIAILFLLSAVYKALSRRNEADGNGDCTYCGLNSLSMQQRQKPYLEYSRSQKTISNFQYDTDLVLIRLRRRLSCIPPEEQYIVAEDFKVSFDLEEERKCVVVPRGTLTDLSSIPRPFRWFAGRVGPHLEAAIVHDYLYIAWQVMNQEKEAKRCYRDYADDLMFHAMWKAGMRFKASVLYCAVRLGGQWSFKERNSGPLILNDQALGKIGRNNVLICPQNHKNAARLS